MDRLRRFCARAAAQTQKALDEQDEPHEEPMDCRELHVFAYGVMQQIRSLGAGAPAELKGEIKTALAPVWDFKQNVVNSAEFGFFVAGPPGAESGGQAGEEELLPRDESNRFLEALKDALNSLLEDGGVLRARPLEDVPTPQKLDGQMSAKITAKIAAKVAELMENWTSGAYRTTQELVQDAITFMWEDLDVEERLNWGESGFLLNLQGKARYEADAAHDPLFAAVQEVRGVVVKNVAWVECVQPEEAP